MRITMNQAEIESAIRLWLAGEGLSTDGKSIDIDLKATRGEAGYTAEIDITDGTKTEEAVAAPAAKPVATATVTKRSPLAAVKPEPEVEEIKAAEPEATEETEQADEAPVAPTKSLFGGMTKPVNA